MNRWKRGTALIISNEKFDDCTGLAIRFGAAADVISLSESFAGLNLEVVVHENITCKEIREKLHEAAMRDHRNSDLFACAVLTHGAQDVVYGTDGPMPANALFAPFKGSHCPSLADKPKLFFIQACRGGKIDRGTVVMRSQSQHMGVDQPIRCQISQYTKNDVEISYRIPSEANFLLAYSSVPGFTSWRDPKGGTPFIQALSSELRNARGRDITNILTRVNYRVAYFFETELPNEGPAKQIPYIASTLTKMLYF